MKEHIARRSKAAGFEKSLLPTFSEKTSQYIRGTLDYLGFNHYTTFLAKSVNYTTNSYGWQDCIEADRYQPSSWNKSSMSWLKVSMVIITNKSPNQIDRE